MIDLNIQNGKLIIDPNTLTVSAFNEIWEADQTRVKSKASNTLIYVFHVCDIRQINPFRDLAPKQKEQMARRNAFGNPDHKFSPADQKLIDRAMAWYNELNKNSVLRFSMAINFKLDEMTDFLYDEKNRITTAEQFEDQSRVLATFDKILKTKKSTDEFVRSELNKVKIKGDTILSPNAAGLLD